MKLTMMMIAVANPGQGSGPAEWYTCPSSYPSTRSDHWIRIHQCMVTMTAVITLLFY